MIARTRQQWHRFLTSVKLLFQKAQAESTLVVGLLSLLKSYGKMAEAKVEGDVEEMNTIAGLGLAQTIMAEDNAHPTTKPTMRAADMMRNRTSTSHAALEELPTTKLTMRAADMMRNRTSTSHAA